MNNKVCVELIVPAIEERYNVFIPINKKTLEIIYLLSKAINEMSNGFFEISNTVSLINGSTGLNYDVDKTFLENGILNGSKIILM